LLIAGAFSLVPWHSACRVLKALDTLSRGAKAAAVARVTIANDSNLILSGYRMLTGPMEDLEGFVEKFLLKII